MAAGILWTGTADNVNICQITNGIKNILRFTYPGMLFNYTCSKTRQMLWDSTYQGNEIHPANAAVSFPQGTKIIWPSPTILVNIWTSNKKKQNIEFKFYLGTTKVHLGKCKVCNLKCKNAALGKFSLCKDYRPTTLETHL